MSLNIDLPQASDSTDDQTGDIHVEQRGNTIFATVRSAAPAEYIPPEVETSFGVTRVRVGGTPPPNESGLSFRKPGMGGPATEITGTTIVRLPGGMEVDVASGIAAGLVSPGVLSINGAVGVFGPSPVAQRTAQHPQQQTNGTNNAAPNRSVDPAAFVPGDAPEALPGKMEENAQELASTFPTHILDKTFAQLINNGMDFDAIRWGTVEGDAGLRSGEGRMAAELLATVLQGNADRVVKACGVSADDLPSFREWCKDAKADDLRQALTQYLFGRSLNGFRSLANAYLRSGPVSEAALAAAQQRGALTYRKLTDGSITVTLPGKPEVPLAVAQRFGWL